MANFSTFVVAILLTIATAEASSSAMYKSAIVQKAKVTPAATQPSDVKAYGGSVTRFTVIML